MSNFLSRLFGGGNTANPSQAPVNTANVQVGEQGSTEVAITLTTSTRRVGATPGVSIETLVSRAFPEATGLQRFVITDGTTSRTVDPTYALTAEDLAQQVQIKHTTESNRFGS